MDFLHLRCNVCTLLLLDEPNIALCLLYLNLNCVIFYKMKKMLFQLKIGKNYLHVCLRKKQKVTIFGFIFQLLLLVSLGILLLLVLYNAACMYLFLNEDIYVIFNT